MFTVLVNIVMCPFSHILVATDTSFYVLVQDVSILLCRKGSSRGKAEIQILLAK